MSGASVGTLERAKGVLARIEGHGCRGLRTRFRTSSMGHVAIDAPAFRDALPFVPGPPAP